jgi:2-polyprenyl-3-methyl-5-hydroxy-6-metoxy-1,4-benzoquinol methylase
MKTEPIGAPQAVAMYRVPDTFTASEYTYNNSELGSASSYLLPAVSRMIATLPPNSTVVDMGCGNGSVLGQLRGRGIQLYGLDISLSGVAAARKAFPDVAFDVADLTSDLSNHPLAGKCDLVVSTEVVEHVFLPRVFARNCYLLLKPGGLLVLSTPYHGYAKNLLFARPGGVTLISQHYGTTVI